MKSRIKKAFSFLRALIKPQHFEFVGYGICYQTPSAANGNVWRMNMPEAQILGNNDNKNKENR